MQRKPTLPCKIPYAIYRSQMTLCSGNSPEVLGRHVDAQSHPCVSLAFLTNVDLFLGHPKNS